MNEMVNFPAIDAKGQIKIELFETGEKVDEINTRNFISKAVQDKFYKMAVKSLFTQNRRNGGRKIFDDLNDVFKCMHLTDATHPADPTNEWFVKGEEIGFALSDTVYSGSSTLQGSYNEVESMTSMNKVKMVFDFPTHAANGTIHSIYFSPRGRAFPTVSNNNLLFDKISVLGGLLSIKEYKDKIYMLRNNTTMEIYNKNYMLLESKTLPIDGNYDFDIVNDYIYITSMRNTGAVYRISVNNLAAHEVIISGPGNTGGICYVPEKEQFMLASTTSNSTSGSYVITLRIYDKNFNALSNSEIINFKSKLSNIRLYNVDGDVIIGNNIISGSDTVNLFEIANANEIVGVMGNNFVMNFSASFPVYIFPIAQIGSRCLLDEPITKKPTQTMKITYEFILE